MAEFPDSGPKQVALTQAIARLSEDPSPANRIALYRALNDCALVLGADNIPAHWQNTFVELKEAATIQVLESEAPGGSGTALLAFTDRHALWQRKPDATAMLVRPTTALRMVIDHGHAGIILNPAGPWAGVPREDVERILDGVW